MSSFNVSLTSFALILSISNILGTSVGRNDTLRVDVVRLVGLPAVIVADGKVTDAE